VEFLSENEGIKEELQSGSEKEKMPLLPLRGVVVFPNMVIPLMVGRPRSMAALEKSMVENKLIMLAAQKNEGVDEPEPDDIFRAGTVAEIKQLIKLPDGSIKIIIEGLQRARIETIDDQEELFEVEVSRIEDIEETGDDMEALMRLVTDYFEDIVKNSKRIPHEVMMTISNIEEGGRLADILITHLNLKVEEQQSILEAVSARERLERLFNLLEREREILTAERRIESRIKQQVEKTQKEYYLREQLKAIKEELDSEEEDDEELAEYREKMEQALLPEEVREKVEKELERLGNMPAMSAEAVVVRNYLDCVLELPWQKEGTDRLDIEIADRILEEDHYALEDVKERILEYLAVRQLSPDLKSPIICLVGAPGVGKTSLARSVARALEKEFLRISLGGVRDEAEIRGHRRTYVGSRPGRIINAMRNAGVKNPLFLLDEVDKMSTDFRGDPSSALLEVLDPEQNYEFSDHYLEMPFDLSRVMFITTANVEHTIPPALLDRMEVIHLPGYTMEEKLEIARRHLIPRQLQEHALSENRFSIDDAALRALIREYTREAGVRTLERKLAALMRKAARAIVEKNVNTTCITAENLKDYLGPPLYRREEERDQSRVGVATGMAYTETGGDLLDIEVAVVPGSGELILTGKLGDVMKESAQAAMSYARSRQKHLGLPGDFHDKKDVHIHVPQGAVPKDGPSAGITIALALISALAEQAIPGDVALSGELTLRGRVLSVGGIKNKVLAAHRSGIRKIVLPGENEPQLEEIPADIRQEMEIKLVEHMDQVLTMLEKREE